MENYAPEADVILYNATTGTEYTGISTAGAFTYTYQLSGPAKLLAR